MTNKNYIYIIFCLFFLCNCVSRKKIVYFQNDKIDTKTVSNSYKTLIKPDDLLQITVSTADSEASRPFNIPAAIFQVSSNENSSKKQDVYLVNNDGTIDFPVLGKLKIGGLSRIEAIDHLKNKLNPDYLKNPIVNIRIANYSITVLGDVNRPGTFTIPNERITIPEAIGLAGDLKITGKRETIKVIREVNDEKKIYIVDLRSNKLFTSPVYYLQQNDLLYVEPNKASSQDAAYNKNTGLIISITSLLITLANFIF